MGDDLTLEVLKQIRDELKSHGVKLDQTNAKLDNTNERLDRVVHEQIRHATAIIELEQGQRRLEQGQRSIVDAMGAVVGELVKLNSRFDNVLTGTVGSAVRETTARVDNLEGRVEKLERRSG